MTTHIKAAARLLAAGGFETMSRFLHAQDSVTCEFWKKFFDADAAACKEILVFLSALQDSQSRPVKLRPPSEAALDALDAFCKFRAARYSKVYRGATNLDALKGSSYTVPHLTFWSQDESWAHDFAAESDEEAVLLEAPFKAKDVLLDLNVVPYAVGPVGREPEIIMRPGTFKVRIVKTFND